MKDEDYQKELKAIKLLQDRSQEIGATHAQIGSDLDAIKKQLARIGAEEITQSTEFEERKAEHLQALSGGQPLPPIGLDTIYQEACLKHSGPIGLGDILSQQDFLKTNQKIDRRIEDFNRRYGLDGWDYAIAGSCGLFAAMLDLLCVKAPPKPTVKWNQQVNGIFNQGVQKAFNKILPPDLSHALSNGYPIGAPDSSVCSDLFDAPPRTLNPINHRLRSLSHDPLLAFIFGMYDMIHGTCTVVTNGEIRSFPSRKGSTPGSLFELLGRMLGHLLSDVNAPSTHGNRGMGLPAPFMGLLRMFEGIPLGDSNFGKQIEWMYVQGYDFRQFVVSSIPMAIMEVMLRAFYIAKQMKQYDAPFGETILDTVPVKINPRFRMMLALAYGTSSAVNAGKMYVTQNILNANYASWMGLTWNGFNALKWALLDRHLKLWGEIESKEIEDIESIVKDLDQLGVRAAHLPV